MKYNGKLFKERLKEVSNDKTNEQISEDINVDTSTISRWSKNIPKTENLLTISETYNCSIDYLLGLDNNRKSRKIDLFDVVKDLFICDMQGNVDCDLVFKSLSEGIPDLGGYNYGAVLFENRYKPDDSSPNNVNYGELFERYSKMKEAFTVIDDERIKIDMIISLLKQYDFVFMGALYDLPFMSKDY